MRLLTKKGYDAFPAVSTLQKAVRRNDEKVAMYFMVELFNSGFDGWIWKRLKVIASEDVGIAHPNMPAIIAALYLSYEEMKKENKDNRPERMYMVHALLLLCRCKKSRLVDYAMITAWRTHDDYNMEIPDYGYDMHTMKGKAMGRGLEHFFENGAHLENHTELPGEQELKEKSLELLKKSPAKLVFPPREKGKAKQETIFPEPETEQQ